MQMFFVWAICFGEKGGKQSKGDTGKHLGEQAIVARQEKGAHA